MDNISTESILAKELADKIKIEKAKKRFVIEGNNKWFLDENGNYTGYGETSNGQPIHDGVYRIRK